MIQHSESSEKIDAFLFQPILIKSIFKMNISFALTKTTSVALKNVLFDRIFVRWYFLMMHSFINILNKNNIINCSQWKEWIKKTFCLCLYYSSTTLTIDLKQTSRTKDLFEEIFSVFHLNPFDMKKQNDHSDEWSWSLMLIIEEKAKYIRE